MFLQIIYYTEIIHASVYTTFKVVHLGSDTFANVLKAFGNIPLVVLPSLLQ
jgi:hypothetical protein